MPFLPRVSGYGSAIRAIAAACLVVLTAASGCDSPTNPAAAPPISTLPTVEAQVVTVQPQNWPTLIRSQGSLISDEVTTVGAKVAGRVAEVHIDLGDAVRAGMPLVTLEKEEFQLQVKQAEAQLLQARSAVGLRAGDAVASLDPLNSPPVRQEKAVWDEAKARLSRAQKLEVDKAISELEFDQIVAAELVAEARYSSAVNSVRERIAMISVQEAELALARQRVEDAVIRASFDGMIQERLVAAGAYMQVGDPVATLVRTHVLRFRGTVPERRAQQLELGQEVRLKIESVEDVRPVRVTRISPALDFATRSLIFEAEISNDDGQLRTGLFAEAEIVVNPSAEALVVPYSSVIEFAGSEKVWKVTSGVSRELEVVTGERRPTGIEILRGLSAGDVIILDATDGRLANILPRTTLSDQVAPVAPAAPGGVMEAEPNSHQDELPSSTVSG
jgi:RND family efflux transporter MFP subunit